MRTMGLLTFMIPVGFGFSLSILLGKYIGKGRADLVVHYNQFSLKLAFLLALF
jgi:Na+-driven multidrug efflux pump